VASLLRRGSGLFTWGMARSGNTGTFGRHRGSNRTESSRHLELVDKEWPLPRHRSTNAGKADTKDLDRLAVEIMHPGFCHLPFKESICSRHRVVWVEGRPTGWTLHHERGSNKKMDRGKRHGRSESAPATRLRLRKYWTATMSLSWKPTDPAAG
jgi:hypothetical protein